MIDWARTSGEILGIWPVKTLLCDYTEKEGTARAESKPGYVVRTQYSNIYKRLDCSSSVYVPRSIRVHF